MKAKPQFVYFLAAASLIEIVVTILALTLNFDAGKWILSLTLSIMGLGLVVESQIRTILKGGWKFDEAEIFGHAVTGVIGLTSLVVGIILLPIFNVAISGGLSSFVIMLLIFQALAIIIETFLI